MKQNSEPAILAARIITSLALAVAFSQIACATLPRYSPPDTQSSFAVPKGQTDFRVNINTAPSQQLDKLPGVGKLIAERIIAHREQYGPFRREEHLMMVRGISDRKFRALWPMIKVE